MSFCSEFRDKHPDLSAAFAAVAGTTLYVGTVAVATATFRQSATAAMAIAAFGGYLVHETLTEMAGTGSLTRDALSSAKKRIASAFKR